MRPGQNDQEQQENAIRGHEFKRWRKSLGYSQKEAAAALGLKRRVVQYYERGERDGKSIEIPLYIRLACFAVVKGVEDYDGPEEAPGKGKRKGKDKGKAKSSNSHGKAEKKHKAKAERAEPKAAKSKPAAEKRTRASEPRKAQVA